MEYDRCVCCGAVVPEGRQVCPRCNANIPDRVKPRTNGDRLRDMNNKELARFLARFTKTRYITWLGYLNQEVDPI